MNEEFVIKTSIWKTILALLGSLLFVIVSLVLIFYVKGLIPTIVGIISVAFFGFGFFVVLFRDLLRRRPRIIINEKGIYAQFLGVGEIDWNDIEFVHFRSDSKDCSITLKLTNPQKYLMNLSRSAKILSRFNGDLDFGIFNFNLTGLEIKPEKIYEIILNHIPEKQIKDLDRIYEIK